MRLHKTSDIRIDKRQRKRIEAAPLNDLKHSIVTRGLAHAPVVTYEDEVPVLVIGERRYRAVCAAHAENLPFYFDGQLVPHDHIPTVTIHDSVSAPDIYELELDENRHRVALTWQEESEALATLHKMRLAVKPQQTLIDTARELSTSGPVFGVTTTARVQQRIAESLLIQRNMHNPAVAKARNAAEAYSAAARHMEEMARGRLTQLKLRATPLAESPIAIRHADLTAALPLMEAGIFDLLCADPPYGQSVDASGFRARTVHHHNYKDDMATARAVGATILTEGFRVCKPRANLFMFNTIDNWDWFRQVCANMGWDYFPRPVIWGKSDSEGLAPWGSQGFRITTEYIFYATKGQRKLISSPVDYLRENRVARDERVYGAEKPLALIRRLIECSTLPGDYVLDPCCGSGTTLVAARDCKRRALGLERDQDAYYTALAKIGRTEGVAS